MAANQSASVPERRVTEGEVRQFWKAIDRTMSQCDPADLIRLYIAGARGLAISFDANWDPFLGHTKGYNNRNQPPRLPIHEPSSVLTLAASWLENSGTTRGGRVFLTANAVFAHGDERIGSWNWPGPDPVRVAIEMLKQKRFGESSA